MYYIPAARRLHRIQGREMRRLLTQEVNFSQTYLLGQLPPRWGIWDVDWLSGTECRHCVLRRNFGRLGEEEHEHTHTHTHTHTKRNTVYVTFAFRKHKHHQLVFWTVLCLLTGRQVEHDANWGRVVNDVRPIVQVVHVVAAVISTVTKNQVQHQVLRESRIKEHQKVTKVDAMTTKMFSEQADGENVIIRLQRHPSPPRGRLHGERARLE